jgi:hypothetical protein
MVESIMRYRLLDCQRSEILGEEVDSLRRWGDGDSLLGMCMSAVSETS